MLTACLFTHLFVCRAGEAPIHYASRYGHMEVIKTLLEANADVTIVGAQGTPLVLAELAHHEGVAEALRAGTQH